MNELMNGVAKGITLSLRFLRRGRHDAEQGALGAVQIDIVGQVLKRVPMSPKKERGQMLLIKTTSLGLCVKVVRTTGDAAATSVQTLALLALRKTARNAASLVRIGSPCASP